MGWWLSDHLGGLRLTVKHHVRGAVVVTIIAVRTWPQLLPSFLVTGFLTLPLLIMDMFSS